MIQHNFRETLEHFGIDSAGAHDLWEDLSARYAEPHRHYHNVHHLDNLVASLDVVKGMIRDWQAVILAIAYHDIVYDVSRNDNEEQSAVYAAQQLGSLIPLSVLQHCTDLILATKSHEVTSNSDENDAAYFTDADLSILGATPELYRAYCIAIRAEYSIYPESLYRQGRSKVLQHFLQMQQIFKTPEFYKQYEGAARINLAAELG
jgi:predicted metal-dependent HD superfamily phosphohydrolase